MSHIVTVRTQIKELDTLKRACTRMGIPAPEEGQFTVYQRTCRGQAVRLPGWRYPVVVDLKTGAAQFDNYRGSWGDDMHLNGQNGLIKSYEKELVHDFARSMGSVVTEEEVLSDGTVRLRIPDYN